MIDRNGSPLVEGKRKSRYSAFIEFSTKNLRGRWSESVIAALTDAHPEALG
jgi:hypothetical protein